MSVQVLPTYSHLARPAHFIVCNVFRVVLEFYILNTSNGVPYLANDVVDKLDQSSVFRKLNDEFSIMGIETKGSGDIVISQSSSMSSS